MTIYDISEKAGVSIATVSRVLNGSNNVSEKTKKKVLDVINQYEYTPNAFARGLGQHHEDNRYHVCRQFGSVPCQSDLLY